MFENALDGQDVIAARQLERLHIARWIADARAVRKKERPA